MKNKINNQKELLNRLIVIHDNLSELPSSPYLFDRLSELQDQITRSTRYINFLQNSSQSASPSSLVLGEGTLC